MSNLDYLNLSTDLRRISLWIQEGRVGLAEPFIKSIMDKFGKDGRVMGKKRIGEWLGRVAAYKERGWRSAEDALTLSVMLKNRFTP